MVQEAVVAGCRLSPGDHYYRADTRGLSYSKLRSQKEQTYFFEFPQRTRLPGTRKGPGWSDGVAERKRVLSEPAVMAAPVASQSGSTQAG
ncbi:hypothetical protein Q3G72_008369 [Acer saccharum]|nr:hypothetical protein Q3G72_008369 [Acer saccharum]